MDKSIKCQVNNEKSSITIETSDNVNDRLNCQTNCREFANRQRHLQCCSEQQPKHSTNMNQTLRVKRNANVHRTHLKRLPSGQCNTPTTAITTTTTTILSSANRSSSQSHHHKHHIQSTKFDEFLHTTNDKLCTKIIQTYYDRFSRFYMIFVIISIFLLNQINCDQGECHRHGILFD